MATTYSNSAVSTTSDVRAAAGVNDALLAIGRVAIAIIFISSGLEKFMGLSEVTAQLAAKGFPVPNIFAIATAALELGGGILIVVGWQTRIFALALAMFTIVAAYFFHDFWHQPAGHGAHRQHDSLHEERQHRRRLPDAVRGRAPGDIRSTARASGQNT